MFTGDWIPDHELARRSGLSMLPAARSPVVGSGFRTARPGVFAIGNLVHPAETADVCALDGRAVASTVQAWLDDAPWPAPPPALAVDPPVRWATYSPRGITLRVDAFLTGRVQIESAGEVVWSGRAGRLVPNRSITVPVPDGAGQVLRVSAAHTG